MRLNVRVRPGSSRNEVRVLEDGSYEVRVTAAPEKGKANAKALRLLADCLRLPVSALSLVRGAAGTKKIVEILGR